MYEELNSSILGSHKYWNNVYNEEIKNFNDHGDVGEIWFGRQTVKRIVKWLSGNILIKKDNSILDIGCGNGMLLLELFKVGFINLYGIDYSKNAIDLANAIAKKEKCKINFSVGNILEDNLSTNYNVCLDKGTYDAISLDPEDAKSKRQIYKIKINEILKENGYFIITSCNWTDMELIQQFNELELIETISGPTFEFGGKTGKTVITVIFKKR